MRGERTNLVYDCKDLQAVRDPDRREEKSRRTRVVGASPRWNIDIQRRMNCCRWRLRRTRTVYGRKPHDEEKMIPEGSPHRFLSLGKDMKPLQAQTGVRKVEGLVEQSGKETYST